MEGCVGADALLTTTGTWGLEAVAPTEDAVACWPVPTLVMLFGASKKDFRLASKLALNSSIVATINAVADSVTNMMSGKSNQRTFRKFGLLQQHAYLPTIT